MSEPIRDIKQPSVEEPQKSNEGAALRPAEPSEIDQVHSWLLEAIEESPYYNDMFKSFERARLSKTYLRSLLAEDPAHIMLSLDDNIPCGFMISGPELGTIWLYWSYLLPDHRRGLLAMSAMRSFISHWDNGRFHKIATYTKHGNKAAEAIMKRAKYKHVCTLEKHIFGEDYLLYERSLNKTSDDYDRGIISLGTLGRIKQKVKNLFGLQ